MSVWPVSPPCYHHADETTVVLTTSSNAQLKVLSPTVLHPVFLDICMISKEKKLEKPVKNSREDHLSPSHPPTHSSNIAHCSLCEYVSLLVLFCMPLFFCLCVSMYMCVFTFSPTWFLLSLSNSPVCNLLINSAAAHQRIKAG